MNPNRYLLTTICALSALLATIAGTNVLVDPFAMYGLVEIAGLNARKPAVYTRVRLHKAYQVRRIKPTALVLGTSRSHVGIRVSHPGWDAGALPRYNLAFDGATTKEMFFYLRHANTVRPLKQVVLGLDAYQLTDAPAATRPDFMPDILLDERSVISGLRVALADLGLLISLGTLRASLETLAGQSGDEPEWFAPDGQRLGEVFFHRSGEMYRDQGPRAYFEAIDRQEIGYKVEWRIPSPASHPQSADHQGDPDTSFDYVRRIVEFCRDNRIDLRIFLTPTHARNLEISAQTGEWSTIEANKRRLAELVGGAARTAGTGATVAAYDFVDFNSITTEPLPALGTAAEMQFYWESSHFKEKAGDFVLDRLFGSRRTDQALPDDFGLRLDPATVDGQLDAIRHRKTAYQQAHREDIAEIAAMIREVVAELSPGTTPEALGLPRQ